MVGFPGENLAIKLWDTIVDKGVCGVLRPWQIKREGLANAEVARSQILMLAQAEKDVSKIKEGSVTAKLIGGDVILNRSAEAYSQIVDLPSLYAVMHDDIVIRNIQGEVNLAKTILKAEGQLLKESITPSDIDVDFDWMQRWRSYAMNVTAEDVQSLWANLLAGEVKSPGRYSLRTMEFLKNITKNDAKEIEKIIPFIFKEGFIYRGYLGQVKSNPHVRAINQWLEWEHLYFMQELGIIQGITEERATITLLPELNKESFLRTTDKVIIYKLPSDRGCETAYISVTKLGCELVDIAGMPSNREYLNLAAEHIRHSGGEVKIADYKETGSGSIDYYNIEDFD